MPQGLRTDGFRGQCTQSASAQFTEISLHPPFPLLPSPFLPPSPPPPPSPPHSLPPSPSPCPSSLPFPPPLPLTPPPPPLPAHLQMDLSQAAPGTSCPLLQAQACPPVTPPPCTNPGPSGDATASMTKAVGGWCQPGRCRRKLRFLPFPSAGVAKPLLPFPEASRAPGQGSCPVGLCSSLARTPTAPPKRPCTASSPSESLPQFPHLRPSGGGP